MNGCAVATVRDIMYNLRFADVRFNEERKGEIGRGRRKGGKNKYLAWIAVLIRAKCKSQLFSSNFLSKPNF